MSGAFDSIHFDNRKAWGLFYVRFEIFKSASFPALIFDFCQYFLRVSLAVSCLLGKINVFDIKCIHIDVVIDCPFG